MQTRYKSVDSFKSTYWYILTHVYTQEIRTNQITCVDPTCLCVQVCIANVCVFFIIYSLFGTVHKCTHLFISLCTYVILFVDVNFVGSQTMECRCKVLSLTCFQKQAEKTPKLSALTLYITLFILRNPRTEWSIICINLERKSCRIQIWKRNKCFCDFGIFNFH